MLMTNQQEEKLSEPGVDSLHNSAALVTAEFASIFLAASFVVLPVRRNQGGNSRVLQTVRSDHLSLAD
jgi:hypothetical protein